MKKHALLSAVFATAATVVIAGSYGVINISEPGLVEPLGFGVARIDQVECQGSAVANGTVIISSVSANGAHTNALVTVTNSAGKVTSAIANSTAYYIAGDKLLRTGTATNGFVRIIVSQ